MVGACRNLASACKRLQVISGMAGVLHIQTRYLWLWWHTGTEYRLQTLQALAVALQGGFGKDIIYIGTILTDLQCSEIQH